MHFISSLQAQIFLYQSPMIKGKMHGHVETNMDSRRKTFLEPRWTGLQQEPQGWLQRAGGAQLTQFPQINKR
jgi:hypothetical protein